MPRSNQALVVLALTVSALLAGCAPAPEPADTIFHGDHIVTMDPQQPTVEAVAVRGETIAAAGPMDEVMALEGPSTRVVDLGEYALLPGFIDSHGHFLGAGRDQHLLVGLHPPPVGDVNNIDDIVRKVRAWIDEHDIPPGEPVTGRGYDDSLLEEGRHPTREDLDRASTEHPIILTHVSGHLVATNSALLAASNITADTPDPPGGLIRRIDGLDGARRGAGGDRPRTAGVRAEAHPVRGGTRRPDPPVHRHLPEPRHHHHPGRRHHAGARGRPPGGCRPGALQCGRRGVHPQEWRARRDAGRCRTRAATGTGSGWAG